MTEQRHIRWSRESKFEPITTTDSKNRLPKYYENKNNLRSFQAKKEEYLRTASFE